MEAKWWKNSENTTLIGPNKRVAMRAFIYGVTSNLRGATTEFSQQDKRTK